MTSFEIKRDLHVHTKFSDGFSSPEELILIGIERNMDQICFTDHYSYLKPAITDETLEHYFSAIQNLKKKYTNNIQIFVGIEVDTSSITEFSQLGYHSWDLILFEYVFNLPEWNTIFSSVLKFSNDFPDKNIGFAHTRFSRVTHAKFDEVMRNICETNLIIELNTSYQNYRDPWFNYLDETNLFSVGSDAHFPEQLGKIKDAVNYLENRDISFDRVIEL